jgi:hypothetical protein
MLNIRGRNVVFVFLSCFRETIIIGSDTYLPLLRFPPWSVTRGAVTDSDWQSAKAFPSTIVYGCLAVAAVVSRKLVRMVKSRSFYDLYIMLHVAC